LATDGRCAIGRRALLARAALLAGAVSLPRRTEGQDRKTTLILLGTGGGPRPRKVSSASARVIVSNDRAYVIDCGNGVARQLAFAGASYRTTPKRRMPGA
jgi:hypothetical protein